MPRPSDSKRARLESYLAESRPALIDETFLETLRERLAPVSNSYLRELVRGSGLPLSPLVEGVRQDSLQEARRTLLALSRLYEESGPARRNQVRSVVIESKTRLCWAVKTRQPLKEEILLWVMTWLENPPVFGSWLALRTTGSGSLLP